MFLEIFCGTAGVSGAMKRKGTENVVPIDRYVPKAPKASVTKLDLTKRDHQLLVLDWIRQPDTIGVMLAPPCGTASLAREIPLEGEDNAPCPLRSEDEPDGLPTLEGLDLIRVEAANILYAFCQEVWDLCCSLNKLCLIENPSRSLFWQTSFWNNRQFLDEYVQHHQACFYGSLRPKWTCLRANFCEVHNIDGVCPGNHYHEPWGVVRNGAKKSFATALEVHYPTKLCDAIADAFIANLMLRGYVNESALPLNPSAKFLAGTQVASSKIPAVVPEFACKFGYVLDASQTLRWPQAMPDIVDAKTLQKFHMGVGALQDSLFVPE